MSSSLVQDRLGSCARMRLSKLASTSELSINGNLLL